MAGRVDPGQFNNKGLIGSGAFGTVYLLKNLAGEKLALKVCQLVGGSDQDTRNEVQTLKTLNHEYILKFVRATENVYEGELEIITEYCCNRDIQVFIQDHAGEVMDERRLVEWIRQIAEALKHVHGENIIHRDLKPANIFLDVNWNTKLGDFGISRMLPSLDAMAMIQCGTPLYMSPEIRQGHPYSYKADIYSLGVIIHELLHMDKTANVRLLILSMDLYQAKIKGPLQKILVPLQTNPAYRPSAAEILNLPIFPPIPPNLMPGGGVQPGSFGYNTGRPHAM